MSYGHFDDERREHVISRPDTPLPWSNYLGTGDFLGTISNLAGGCSFYRDARLRRLTRLRLNGVPTDAGGRYVCLRDDEGGSIGRPRGSRRAPRSTPMSAVTGSPAPPSPEPEPM